MEARRDKAQAFRALHIKGRPVALANAWDPVSAAVIEHAGFAAVATTSGGVAWANGCSDGNRIAAPTLLGAVDRMLAAVSLPLSVDIEGGLSHEPDAVASLVAALASRDVAGVNLEDSWDNALLPISTQQERLSAARAASPSLFLNARVDTFFFGTGDLGARLNDAVERASAFVEAGADGIFVPGLTGLAEVEDLVSRVSAPVNILTGPGGPSVAELAAAGVSRVSVGTTLAEAAYSHVYDLAQQFRDTGKIEAVAMSLNYPELNTLVDR